MLNTWINLCIMKPTWRRPRAGRREGARRGEPRQRAIVMIVMISALLLPCYY